MKFEIAACVLLVWACQYCLAAENDMPGDDAIAGVNYRTLTHVFRQRGKDEPPRSEYASITSFEELKSVADNWHYLGRYDLGRYSKTNDLIRSAVRFAAVKDENWGAANYYLAHMLLAGRYFKPGASVLASIVSASEIAVDASLRQKAMFDLAVFEFTKTTSAWSSGDYESAAYPDRSACDVARELFKRITESNSQVKTDMGADLHMLADAFLEALDQRKSHPRAKLDDVATVKTNLVKAREPYDMDGEQNGYLRQALTSMNSPAWKAHVETMSLEDRRLWATYAGWALFDLRNYQETINLLEPLLGSEIWENRLAYLNAQYYLAQSYERFGDLKKAKTIGRRVVAEGFDVRAMTPDKRQFFNRFVRPPKESFLWNEAAESQVLNPDKLATLGSTLDGWKIRQMTWPSAAEISSNKVAADAPAVGASQAQQSESPRASDVLSRMQAFDDTLMAGFTAGGTIPEGSFGIDSPKGRIAWTITMTNGRCVIVEKMLDEAAPAAGYVKQPEWLCPAGQFSGVTTTRITGFGPEYSIQCCVQDLYDIDPNGEPRKADADSPQMIVLYAADDPALTLPYKQIMWLLGRGYARFINEVEELAVQDDGTIRLVAAGTGLGGPRMGRWEMTVEPSADYMVRTATFSRKEEPMAVIATIGARRESGICIPQTANWQDSYGPGLSKRTVVYACETIKNEPDRAILETAQKALYGPYERYTDILDNRTRPSSPKRCKAGSQYPLSDRIDFSPRCNPEGQPWSIWGSPPTGPASDSGRDEKLLKLTEVAPQGIEVPQFENEGPAVQITHLLQAMRRARRPAANMRLRLVETRYGHPKDLSASGIVGPQKRRWERLIIVSGKRSQVETECRNYAEHLQAWESTKHVVSVYDGEKYRCLSAVAASGPEPEYFGTIDVKDDNRGVLSWSPLGWLLAADLPPETLANFDFKLQPSPADGMYVLDMINKRGGGRSRLTIDGNRGFNLVKVETFGYDGSPLYEGNFRLRRYGEIWYPCVYRSTGKRPPVRRTVEFKSVEFDVPVTDGMFGLEFPNGTRVRDRAAGVTFMMGAATEACLP
ncbi:MAG: hypothetical protein IH624_12690 [Phycisphaerae bacterium]|nr:hypothetical protein [Phycisphaerae bacterium]